MTAKDGQVVNVEGDPHPINEGALCSKGEALIQIANNERRLSKVKYRAPGSRAREERDWGWTIQKIAENIKETRDATFREKPAPGLHISFGLTQVFILVSLP